MVLSCGPGVKVVNAETGRVAWHFEEVSYQRMCTPSAFHYLGGGHCYFFCDFTRWQGVCVCLFVCVCVRVCTCTCIRALYIFMPICVRICMCVLLVAWTL